MNDDRAQRRLVAILAADVVGYSRLMSADEAGTLDRLKALRRQVVDAHVAGHSGRVVKLMGDGMLAEFPSVVDAVSCAVAIQRDVAAHERNTPEARRITFRIGINLGDVMVDGADLYGDGVNIAARLEQIAGPGEIFVSGTVFEHIGSRLDITFEDCGEQQLKNIDRPLRIFRIKNNPHLAADISTATAIVDTKLEKPSIAVLPFANMSGDPEQEFFSDGITEDIITELSRFRSLFVIARNSTLAFKGQQVDIREIGRKLGVRYVVEGSVRRAGSRARVTAQLIEAATGTHLWAERYDRELADVFEMQDEVARQVVVNIAPRLYNADLNSAKRRSPSDLRAYEFYLRAKALVDAPADYHDLLRAREYCDRAIAMDPSFARAYAYKAFSYIIGTPLVEPNDLLEWRSESLKWAERAVALDDLDNVCHWAMGETSFWASQPERARRHMRRSLALNPNDADVLAVAGMVEAALGDAETALRNMAMARERNPTNPALYHWLYGVTLATLGRYEEALAEYDQFSPPNVDIMKLQTITLVQLGRIDEARAVVQAMLARRPDLTVAKMTRSDGAMPDAVLRAESLRIAGLPE
jgi:adenylate cyclase